MRRLLMILLALAAIPALAQREHLDKGDEFYNKRFYKEAITEYKLALEEDLVVNRFYMTQQIARTYKMLFVYENAEIWYSKLIALGDEDNEPVNYLHYAQILQNNEKYEEAGEMYRIYASKIGEPESRYKKLAQWALEHPDSVWDMDVLRTNIETGSRSMGIWIHGNHMYYGIPVIQEFDVKTSFYDLGRSVFVDSVTFGDPEKLKGSTDRSFYEGTPCITLDGKYIYYTANASEAKKYRSKKKREKANISKEGLNILHVYRAENVNGEWSNVMELNINESNSSAAFPFVSKDGKTLYFASDREGGQGGFDLYRATRVNDSIWSAPMNMGEEVNSFQDEMYPFRNDTAFFYSSKGKPGYGGADVYWGRMEGTRVVDIQNAGKPINSSKDDFSLITVEDENGLMKGYLSSNRDGTHGYDHIFYFSEQAPPVYPDTIVGVARNKITMKPIEGVKVDLSRYDEAEEWQPDSSGITNKTGMITLILDKHVPYFVRFTKEGFHPVEIQIPAEDRDDVLALFGAIEMKPVAEKNTIIQIPNIYFDYDKATIREESFDVLNNVVSYLNDNPDIRVELSAHTDARGSDRYNERLSEKRARSTVEYLVEKGIKRSRLVPRGYGETKIQNHCKNGVKCSDEEHEVNRRVELKVL